jgi:hypothetical protein
LGVSIDYLIDVVLLSADPFVCCLFGLKHKPSMAATITTIANMVWANVNSGNDMVASNGTTGDAGDCDLDAQETKDIVMGFVLTVGIIVSYSFQVSPHLPTSLTFASLPPTHCC